MGGGGGLFRTPVPAGGSLDHFSGAHSKAKHRNALDRPFNRAFNHNNNTKQLPNATTKATAKATTKATEATKGEPKKNKAGLSETPQNQPANC